MVTPAAGGTAAADGPEEQAQRVRRAAYLTAGLGTAHAALFLLTYWLDLRSPDVSDSAATLTDAYRRDLTLTGLYLTPFAGIAFIWFNVALRMWLSAHQEREKILSSNIQVATGIVYVALYFVAGAAAATSAANIQFAGAPVNQAIVPHFARFGSTILYVFVVRMAAMFVFTTSTLARSTRVLPRWFVFLGFAAGLFLLLSATFSRFLVFLFPGWVVMLCALVLYSTRRKQAPTTADPPAAEPQRRSPR